MDEYNFRTGFVSWLTSYRAKKFLNFEDHLRRRVIECYDLVSQGDNGLHIVSAAVYAIYILKEIHPIHYIVEEFAYTLVLYTLLRSLRVVMNLGYTCGETHRNADILFKWFIEEAEMECLKRERPEKSKFFEGKSVEESFAEVQFLFEQERVNYFWDIFEFFANEASNVDIKTRDEVISLGMVIIIKLL